MRILLAAIAMTLGFVSATDAATVETSLLAGGPIYSPNNQSYAVCSFVNFGTANVTVASQGMYWTDSRSPIEASYGCPNGYSLTPNTTCLIYSQGTLPSGSISCKLNFSNLVGTVRGSLALYDSNNNVLQTVELR